MVQVVRANQPRATHVVAGDTANKANDPRYTKGVDAAFPCQRQQQAETTNNVFCHMCHKRVVPLWVQVCMMLVMVSLINPRNVQRSMR